MPYDWAVRIRPIVPGSNPQPCPNSPYKLNMQPPLPRKGTIKGEAWNQGESNPPLLVGIVTFT